MKKMKYSGRLLAASFVSVILSCSMLLGTTYAWFHDSVSANVGTITSGTLDVEILGGTDGNGLEFVSADGKAVLWEPGASYQLQQFQVKNEGNLNLRYQLEVTGIGDSEQKLNEVITWSVQRTYTVDGNTWTVTEGLSDLATAHTLAPGAVDTYVITGTMDNSAGNQYQNLTITGIGVTAKAWQAPGEFDSYSSDYDKDAVYTAEPAETRQAEEADPNDSVQVPENGE